MNAPTTESTGRAKRKIPRGAFIWAAGLVVAALALGPQVIPVLLPARPIPPGVYRAATLQGRPTSVDVGTELTLQLGDPAGSFVGKLTKDTVLILGGSKVDMKTFAQFVMTSASMHTEVESQRPGEISAISLAQ